jgi:hypothetical protein
VNFRKQILQSQSGFNVISTLVAVAVGGLIASLVVTIITQAVKGRGQVTERDEMSELALFVKNTLTTDSTCSAVLSGQRFIIGGIHEIQLATGYGDQASAILKKGFKFAGGSLEIGDLSIEDRSPGAVEFHVNLTDPKTGAQSDARVQRHMARVKLQVLNVSSGSAYRPRYMEFPVLVNAEKKVIQMCNNQMNVGDACQSLGFKWDTSKIPAECVPSNSCLFGGSFVTRTNGTCVTPNPVTGTCGCQPNYSRLAMGSINLNMVACQKGCDSLSYDLVNQCYSCPQ